MRFSSGVLLSSLILASPLAASHVRRGPTAHRATHKGHTPAAKPAGQRVIDSARATQIQAALIKAGYMTGTPSGTWDEPTQAAMEKLQGDNGWQTKLVPDARALAKLGLSGSASPEASLAQPGPTGAAANL